MPARKIKSKKLRKGSKKGKSKRIFIFFLAVSVLGFFILLKTQFWQKNQRLILAINSSPDIKIVVFDNNTYEITTILVPKSIEVEVSRDLGIWRIGSLWQLGINEKLGGKLFSDTITKNLRIPTYIWADKEAQGFASGNIFNVFKAVFLPYKTNLEFGDKIRLGLFSIRVKDFKMNTINLSNTEMLYKDNLKDGNSGFVISDKFPRNLLPYISDPIMSKQVLKITITDATGKPEVSERVGEIVEVMGPKVAAIVKREKGDFDCTVKSVNKEIGIRISRVFSCRIGKGNPEGNFDIELILGGGFAERF